jgi:hypothetical protein
MAEQKLNLTALPPRDALRKLVEFTWNYYLENPEFLTLVNSENLHKARHIEQSEAIRHSSRSLVSMVKNLLDRGVAAGVFRSDVDPVQLNITIAAIGYYYLTNRFTGAILFERDFMDDEALRERLAFNIETIEKMVCI